VSSFSHRIQTRYYAPPSAVHGDRLVLPPEEAHHALRVLRAAAGQEIEVVDGEGGWYRVRLDEADRRTAAGTILERRREVGEPDYSLTVGLAMLKNPSRYETFLEKATELGVTAVLPLQTARTQKARLKTARAQNILVSAMKQCGRSRQVHLSDVVDFTDVIAANTAGLKVICHEAGPLEDNLSALLAREPSLPRHILLLVGPEGGFSDDEVAAAQRAGFQVASLGPRRLRAETAALTAVAAIMLSAATT